MHTNYLTHIPKNSKLCDIVLELFGRIVMKKKLRYKNKRNINEIRK